MWRVTYTQWKALEKSNLSKLSLKVCVEADCALYGVSRVPCTFV
jgi:hypothetical protein